MKFTALWLELLANLILVTPGLARHPSTKLKPQKIVSLSLHDVLLEKGSLFTEQRDFSF